VATSWQQNILHAALDVDDYRLFGMVGREGNLPVRANTRVPMRRALSLVFGCWRRAQRPAFCGPDETDESAGL